MTHMDELRGMVELFSYNDDDIEIKDDELLANLMLYRYENKISILDDHDLDLTEDIYQRQWLKYPIGELLKKWKRKKDSKENTLKNIGKSKKKKGKEEIN